VSLDYPKWVMSIGGCLLVGLSGIFPLLLFPHEGYNSESKVGCSPEIKSGISPRQLKRLLNFAVGSLLGDVFLHLLPEAWSSARESGSSKHESLMCLGSWVLIGIISFFICEKLVTFANSRETDEDGNFETDNSISDDSSNNNVENHGDTDSKKNSKLQHSSHNKHIAGYLNLVANGFDNFTHGLAVAGSFVISFRIGILTTIAILLHEIPHEIADFAILLRAGFNPWSAAKAQLYTATVGLFGAIFTLSVDSMQSMGNLTWWILPFTSGCFINIALTNLLPDLVKEEDPKEAVKQFAGILLGIGVMAFVSMFHEE